MALHSQQTYELDNVTQSSPSFNEDPKAPSKDVLLPKTSTHEASQPRVAVKKRSTQDLLPLLRSLLLPMVAIAFLTFCYVVHYHIVQVRTGVFDNSPKNINSIKSGVTSISILIITLGLYPVYSLISDLKSEEFFRTIRNARAGASLAAVNGISNPSFGLVESLLVLVQRRASPLFLTAVISAFIAFSTSTVAPAALSVSTALFDSDIMAFTVGAILRDDIQNSTAQIIDQPTKTSQLFDRAASVAWVETALQVPYSFKVASNMIVPLPLILPLNVSARWLSDVVVTNPSCTWPNPRLTMVPVTDTLVNDINIAFPDLGLDMPMRSSSFSRLLNVSADTKYPQLTSIYYRSSNQYD
ncbi:hypothetical protein C8Q75DRAFT_34017 [Abortiporus biennis]|nr:hypothetical protein C8Q75DRAFT_34017 [Abortiporus biennis]